MSAAMLIGSGLPEDSEAITRRALEIAMKCFAFKVEPKNVERWEATEKRRERWERREQGQDPGTFRDGLSVNGEPLYTELKDAWARLSDLGVHFTPEFSRRIQWQEIPIAKGVSDFSFGVAEGEIERSFLKLCEHHELIIRAFDRYQDGNMLKQPDVEKALHHVHVLQQHYRDLLRPILDALVQSQPELS